MPKSSLTPAPHSLSSSLRIWWAKVDWIGPLHGLACAYMVQNLQPSNIISTCSSSCLNLTVNPQKVGPHFCGLTGDWLGIWWPQGDLMDQRLIILGTCKGSDFVYLGPTKLEVKLCATTPWMPIKSTRVGLTTMTKCFTLWVGPHQFYLGENGMTCNPIHETFKTLFDCGIAIRETLN